jgi:hypothetical protein
MNLTEDEARKIAHSIAFGHAYWKHAAVESEMIMTESSFEQLILGTLLNPAMSKQLRRGRFAYWEATEGFLVVHDPTDPDMGTAYWPAKGSDEYKRLR